jgi:hypothetical protein
VGDWINWIQTIVVSERRERRNWDMSRTEGGGGEGGERKRERRGMPGGNVRGQEGTVWLAVDKMKKRGAD